MSHNQNNSPSLYYRKRISDLAELLHKEKRYRQLLSLFRLASFIGILVCVVKGAQGSSRCFLWAALLLLAFVALVMLFVRKSKYVDYVNRLLTLNKDELAQCEGSDEIFYRIRKEEELLTPEALDLDFFNKGRLFAHINRTISDQGERKLAGQILSSQTNAESLGDEQKAVKELATMPEWRQWFICKKQEKELLDSRPLCDWVSQDRREQRLGFIWQVLRFAIPLFSVAILLAVMFYDFPGWIVLAWIVWNFMLLSVVSRRIIQEHRILAERYRDIQTYRREIALLKQVSFRAASLQKIQQLLMHDAEKGFSRLERILTAFDNRLNFLVMMVLNGLFVWDLHCVFSLYTWHKHYGIKLAGWLSALEELDVLVSKANFAFNHPGYVYPRIKAGVYIDTEKMGHPLIPERERVENDFTLNEGQIAIVTGANMAGKSTFLRTIGVNYLLANAGMPVCASSFFFTPGNLLSSLRTQDSLEKHESYFAAELRRLKTIVQEVTAENGNLFLIDEMLKGTNSEDKTAGSMAIIRNLISKSGTGLIATHDLPVTKLAEEYPELIRNFCFEIQLEGTSMTFDYTLRKGVTQHMNASLLLKQMGLAGEEFFNKKQN